MPKYSIAACEWCFATRGPALCDLAAEAGLDGLSVNVARLDDTLVSDPTLQAAWVDAAARQGICLCALALNCFGEVTLLHPERAAEREALAIFLEKCVEAAARMGIPVIQVPFFGGNAIATSEDMGAAAIYLRMLCDAAAKKDITVGVEAKLNADDIIALMARVDRANFGIYMDTQNPAAFGFGDPVEMIAALAGHICQVHLKDGAGGMGNCRLGEGETRFHACARALRDAGYAGWLVSENNYILNSADDLHGLARDIAAVRQAFGM